MSKTTRALKLYIKTAAHPFVIGFGLFMMIGMALAFILEPAAVGSKDYLSMLGAVQMGKIGTVFMVVVANAKIQQNKFFSSCICAKEVFVIGPVFVITAMNVLYDILLAVAAYINLGTAGLSDLLVFNTASTVLLIIGGGCCGKKGVPFISVIQGVAYMAFFSFPIILKATSNLQGVLGLPLTAAIMIIICGYILSIMITIGIESFWWKRGDKFFLPNPAMMNALGGQENE